jgi:lipoate-protein ligase A
MDLGEVRLILDSGATGAHNMATDEALLDSIGVGAAPTTIRLYTFRPATLSVGRFQKTRGVIDVGQLQRDGVGFVRRPSGGQAVLHADELTYCVVLPRTRTEGFGKRMVYQTIVPLLIAGLKRLGVTSPQSVASARGERTDPDCFASSGEYEIDGDDRRKLVGSAQMVSRNAVLQHGSIPLGPGYRGIRRYLLPTDADEGSSSGQLADGTSVAEQIGTSIGFEHAKATFAEALSSVLHIRESGLTDDERRRRGELIREKYGREEWNETP